MDLLRRRIGDFYTVEHIGSGGMSQVFLAVNPRSREKRAIKVLSRRATSPASDLVRFKREIEIIRKLDHPGIVRILESGAEEGFYYYMMEYFPAGSLGRRISRGRVALDEALPLFRGIVSAMAYAHSQGVVHRDLKPANILLRDGGEAVVTDFGIAKTLDGGAPSVTMSNEILGTIAYLAPEQRASSKRVDRRADVFALGAILYEMVMGFPPLGKFPWPCETQPAFPKAVQAALERCLAIDPERRFDDAGRLAADLDPNGAGDHPAAARRSPPAAGEPATGVTDRIDRWFEVLSNGTTRERLAAVRDMIETITAGESSAILKLYGTTPERVRWGLIRVFGELRLEASAHILLGEMRNPSHREAAVEALGRIGVPEAFEPILELVLSNPQFSTIFLTPLVQTGGERAIGHVGYFLRHPMATIRLAAVRALAALPSEKAREALIAHLGKERDHKIRREVFAAIALSACTVPASPATDADTVVLTRQEPA